MKGRCKTCRYFLFTKVRVMCDKIEALCWLLPKYRWVLHTHSCGHWKRNSTEKIEQVRSGIAELKVEIQERKHDKTINMAVDVWGGAGPDCMVVLLEAA